MESRPWLQVALSESAPVCALRLLKLGWFRYILDYRLRITDFGISAYVTITDVVEKEGEELAQELKGKGLK
jgi:hypothetical protein